MRSSYRFTDHGGRREDDESKDAKVNPYIYHSYPGRHLDRPALGYMPSPKNSPATPRSRTSNWLLISSSS